MKIVKKIYRLRLCSWSGGGRPAGVLGCWISSYRGSPPLGGPPVEYSNPLQIFFYFFVMKIYFLFVVLNRSLVVIFSC